ncbi:alpha/beta hydrolase family protein [Sulfitobacter donghicola]|uniref:Dienelactone hydrolase n=1 Tax=Sulfitobacter donghicola DSW-25 = KCTC 12864 = JCM 14565 TaxID=1300350 RepID=A0A073IWG2_9RHOB|nr:alpha/beta fold hydrolase [Sulfitobacter donghicola]KEJ89717.1 dienelactone hydrolase [Sulfitobacter donghicola DSW-25 = KCTC 12864 = JCM 14565]KIN67189.1 putative dienelactone hydrolase [Sulfitobacter donghicola DSW-25 = KCTC 12864 = JCM 14565]
MFTLRNFAKKATVFTAAALTLAAGYYTSRPAYEGNVGITYSSAFAPARNEEVDFNIWYPAKKGGRQVTVGGNGVFYGSPAGRNAPHDGARHPVVLISHGAGGNAGQFGWIASALAEQGYVVVLPNHPGTTTGNASAKAAVRVWERPKDVSAVLDHLVQNPQDYPYMDTDRIAALGFSAGGYTAMALSGARVDPDLLQRFCDESDHGMSDCAFLAHYGIDLHSFDLSPAAQDLSDARVDAAVIIDPGIVSTLTESSLADIDIPMMVINLGSEGEIPAGVYAKDAARMIERASYATVQDANHFSFLAQCKERGAQILEKEGEPDALCHDSGDRSRAEIHQELTAMIVANLQSNL